MSRLVVPLFLTGEDWGEGDSYLLRLRAEMEQLTGRRGCSCLFPRGRGKIEMGVPYSMSCVDTGAP